VQEARHAHDGYFQKAYREARLCSGARLGPSPDARQALPLVVATVFEREVEEGRMLNRLRRRQPVPDPSYEERIAVLERQVRHLEELLEGLQDAVHRESVRRDHEAAEVQRQISPPELARALSEHARRRGLE
jgi:hypothetical protein